MREIKFRAWDEEDKVMVVQCSSLANRLSIFFHDVEMLDLPLMQYTGLKDKNGVEIYEGDIIKNSLNDILEVVWDEDRCCFDMRGRYEKSHIIRQLDCDIVIDLSVEVIGNIYENKNLLE